MTGKWGRIGAAIRAHFFETDGESHRPIAACGVEVNPRAQCALVLTDKPARKCFDCARKLRLATAAEKAA